jgi:predicted metal-dependent HD superfamily phosphohydrolase
VTILAADPDEYRRYAALVREEHRHVRDAQFRTARRKVLRSLLRQPSIFRTARARELFEEAARANVAAELERLAR